MADLNSPWTVGVLFSQSGVTGYVERSQLQGTLLAIEEINAGGGVMGASDPAHHLRSRFGTGGLASLSDQAVG